MVEQANDERTTTKNLQLAAEHIVRLIPMLGTASLVGRGADSIRQLPMASRSLIA